MILTSKIPDPTVSPTHPHVFDCESGLAIYIMILTSKIPHPTVSPTHPHVFDCESGLAIYIMILTSKIPDPTPQLILMYLIVNQVWQYTL